MRNREPSPERTRQIGEFLWDVEGGLELPGQPGRLRRAASLGGGALGLVGIAAIGHAGYLFVPSRGVVVAINAALYALVGVGCLRVGVALLELADDAARLAARQDRLREEARRLRPPA